jgi:RND superfamily resistance-nodulation-cell division antiporter
MLSMTKFVLRRPVTTFLVVITLIFFGFMNFSTMKMELLPNMNFPYLIVTTTYPGASPEDVDELLTKPVEEEVSLLSDVKQIQSLSNENFSMVIIRYNYGTNMTKAYDSLKKKMDAIKSSLPEDAKDISIMEVDINARPGMVLSINNKSESQLYNYVENSIKPEFEKLSTVASLSLSGGQESYVKVELSAEKLQQYHLTIEQVVGMMQAAKFTYPAGRTRVGDQELSISTSQDYSTIEELRKLPITTGTGNTLTLSDLATVGSALSEKSGIGRYNGEDTITLSINKLQSKSDIAMSKDVTALIKKLEAQNPNLEIHVIQDFAENIKGSLSSVVQTMIMAIVISMLIIFLFFGDLKASLIVGSSIPLAILGAIVFMGAMGYSLNMLTLSALVLGVGMMVDNSIVVLEACFRAMDDYGERQRSLREAALDSVRVVGASVFGGTLTTCVVFLPLGFLQGISGQYFKPLGFTIVFCMVASLISAVTIVPLCFTLYKPKENSRAIAYRGVRLLQDAYRNTISSFLRHKKSVVFATVGILIISLVLSTQLRTELMADIDTGSIEIAITQKPGLSIEEKERVMGEIEEMVAKDPDTDRYTAMAGGSALSTLYGGSTNPRVTVYLKKDRSMKTKEKVKVWKKALENRSQEVISIKALSDTSMSGGDYSNSNRYEIIIQGQELEELQQKSNELLSLLQKQNSLTGIHSSLENAAPLLQVKVDPIKAAAEGLSPIQIAQTLNTHLSGKTAMKMTVEGQKVDVKVEYPKDQYDTIEKVKAIRFTTPTGAQVSLESLASIKYADSPAGIEREDKKYLATITANYTEEANSNTKAEIDALIEKKLGENISVVANSQDQSMKEEFADLFRSIAMAVFLVFVVMAAQFESTRFSFMVMTTIPFSLIGSFGLLWLFDAALSMTSLLGFLMLIGTVVNNGILYVDTVNQYRQEMPLDKALVESGATRLRPILMTTLTTVLSMFPMAMGFGDNGALMQGLALVNVGGLVASTLLALLLLPVYYMIIYGRKKQRIKV